MQGWRGVRVKATEIGDGGREDGMEYPPVRLQRGMRGTGTCFIKIIYAPSSSLLQGKHLPFTPSPLRLNIFRLFVILSLTQLYRYTPEIFLFSTATFKYKYRAPSDELDKNIQRKSHFLFFSH
jgi:hypothetical protein